jgi:hypothetical protein
LLLNASFPFLSRWTTRSEFQTTQILEHIHTFRNKVFFFNSENFYYTKNISFTATIYKHKCWSIKTFCARCTKCIIYNKKFWEELIISLPLIRHGSHRKRCRGSCYLATIGGYRDKPTEFPLIKHGPHRKLRVNSSVIAACIR